MGLESLPPCSFVMSSSLRFFRDVSLQVQRSKTHGEEGQKLPAFQRILIEAQCCCPSGEKEEKCKNRFSPCTSSHFAMTHGAPKKHPLGNLCSIVIHCQLIKKESQLTYTNTLLNYLSVLMNAQNSMLLTQGKPASPVLFNYF